MTRSDAATGRATEAITRWGARIQAGLISGLLALIFAIANASLVAGAAAPEMTGVVIGMALVATAVLCFTLGSLSRFKGIVPIVQDVPSAALGAVLVAELASRAGTGERLAGPEVVLLCVAATLSLALASLLFGVLRLAAVMRFAPRPVMAGFLAGSGYFVVLGALGICLGTNVTWSSLPQILAPQTAVKVLFALVVAAALAVGVRRLPVNIALAVTFVVALLVFHGIAAIGGYAQADLVATGWFATLPEAGLTWPPVRPDQIDGATLAFVARQGFPLATLVLLSTAALLMYTSALEALSRRDMDLDRELKVLGVGNLLSAALGGVPGYHGLVTTVSALKVAGGHRLISYVAGGMALLAFLQGDAILQLLPLPLFAGYMIWVGGDIIHSWLIRETRITPRGESWLTAAVVLAIAVFGLFEGAVFGLAAGGLLFIVNYSRLDPVRGVLSGDVYHGAAELSAAQVAVLEEHGAAITVLKLQGYVFFGTAHRVRARIKTLMQAQPARFLILDLESVSGVDATAADTFKRVTEDLGEGIEHVTLTGMTDAVAGVFARSGLLTDTGARFGTAPDLNAALDRYNQRLLLEHGPGRDGREEDIDTILTRILGDAAMATRLRAYLEPVDAAPGEDIIREGERSSDIFVLESGAVDILVGHEAARRTVRRIGPGAILGEISYYSGGLRTSTVRAVGPARLWRLSSSVAERVLAEAPDLSSRFHQGVAAILADRVAANTRLIRMLQA